VCVCATQLSSTAEVMSVCVRECMCVYRCVRVRECMCLCVQLNCHILLRLRVCV